MKLDYHPRLDGIRAVAVAMVLQTHFISLTGRLSFGAFGVRLFFVLSGYLISRIIFDYADRNVPLFPAAGQFYWRRLLRLTPPLYLAIAICSAFGVANMRQDWLWHAAYLTNIKEYIDGQYSPALIFWSLAVEEQFYIVWFFALLATPLRHTLKLIVAGIAAGQLFKLAIQLSGPGWASYADVLLPASIDYLCLGALIAWAERGGGALDIALRAKLTSPPLIAILVVALIGALALPLGMARSFALDFSMIALSFCLIVTARNGAQGWYLDWLAHPLMVHIGRISYGIYVYHYFVPQILTRYGLLEALRSSPGGRPLMLATEVALTLIVAELSWRLVERPISRLRTLVSVKSVTSVVSTRR